MDTLYNLLGALPKDDAEGLRTAFRRAVKGAHPDLRPGDPDAAVRFRQIVRANEILTDKDQRAAYDHLLSLAQIEKDPAAAHPIAAKVHRIASGVMALATVSIVTAVGYILFTHMPLAAVVPRGGLWATHAAASPIDLAARLSASIAAVSPADAPDPAAVSAFIARAEGNIPVATPVANPAPAPVAEADGASSSGIGLPADPAPDYARLLEVRSTSALDNGDATGAIADPGPIARLDSSFTASYVDRGLLFIREKKDEHAFPRLPPLKHAEKPGPGRPKSLLATSSRTRADALPRNVPLPQPRTAPRFMSHDMAREQPSFASVSFSESQR
jgi:hypothetical protein